MIIFNSNVLKFGGFWLGFGSSPTPPPTPTIYRINVPTVQHGTVAVNPTEGPTGTLVTISTTPDTGYELDTISLTGAELINGNQFYIDGADVTVNVTFKEATTSDEVQIGNQIWKNENLKVDDGGEGIRKVNIGVLNGYDYGTEYYYTLAAARRVAANIPGWRLPNESDFKDLEAFLISDGVSESDIATVLKTTSGWDDNMNGTDTYGFHLTAAYRGSPGRPAGAGAALWERDTTHGGRQAELYMSQTRFEYTYFNASDMYGTIRLIKEN